MSGFYPASNMEDVLEDADAYDWSVPTQHSFDPESVTANVSSDLAEQVGQHSMGVDEVNVNKSDRTTEPQNGQDLLQESAAETLSRLSNYFLPIIEDNADTLIWLGVPPQHSGQDHHEYAFIQRQFQIPYLMNSNTLRKLGSPMFDSFLGPKSVRVERRLKKRGVHKLAYHTEKIKYYIDLSPDINDDEALIQLTQITVPAGALIWHKEAGSFDVVPEHVCGRDDFDIPPRKNHSYNMDTQFTFEEGETLEEKLSSNQTTADSVARRFNSRHISKKPKADPYNLPLEEEYTRVRHHTAIARLLHAGAGNDPKLDSAAKMWAYCMLANYFECATNPNINQWIISWLLESGNMNFIQMHPDIAYRIAIATQSVWLLKCTFAILVSKQAMLKGVEALQMAGQSEPRKACLASSCLDDDEINRIDHAAEAFARRIRKTLYEVATEPGTWSSTASSYPEMRKLDDFEVEDEKDEYHLHLVKSSLKNYIRRLIYMTFSDAYPFDNKNVPAFKATAQFASYATIPQFLKIFTQYFWEVLRKEEFHRDYLDTANNHAFWNTTWEGLAFDGTVSEVKIPYVSRQQLYDTINDMNDHVAAKEGRPAKRREIASPEEGDLDHYAQRELEAVTEVPTDDVVYTSYEDVGSQYTNSQTVQGNIDATGTDDEDWDSLNIEENDYRTLGNMPLRPKLSLNVSRDISQTFNSGVTYQPAIPELSVGNTRSSGYANFCNTNAYSKAPGPTVEVSMNDDPSWSAEFAQNNTRSDTPGLVHASANNISTSTSANPNKPNVRFLEHRPKEKLNHSPGVSPKQGVQFASTETNRRFRIDPEGLLRDISHLSALRLHHLLVPGWIADGSCDFDIPVGEINTLLCLSEEEYKYLPLWAGGFDDGSGGVFNDGADVPDAPDVADGGFRGGAMGIIPGVGSSLGGSMAGSEFEDLGTEVGISTVGKASRYATDGTATDTVMSLDD